MAIDILQENCVSLSEAARLLPRVRGKKPPHPMTIYRWAVTGLKSKGGKRVHLETVWVGGTRVTSVEALERFFARKQDDTPTAPNPVDAEKRLAAGAARAVALLKRKGMLHDG